MYSMILLCRRFPFTFDRLRSMPSGQQFAYFAAIFGAGLLALAMAVFVFLPVIIIAPAKCLLSPRRPPCSKS
jgi:hypothetical protein